MIRLTKISCLVKKSITTFILWRIDNTKGAVSPILHSVQL